MKYVFALLAVALLAVPSLGEDAKLVQKLQDTSVTIRSGSGWGSSQGSGNLVTRKRGDETITFVWTAAHVIDNLRQLRPYVDPNTGSAKIVIEFSDANIVQEFRQNGRRVGEIKMDAQVVKYSDAENGEDLALLRVRKTNFVGVETSTDFYLDETIPPIGTELYHVGSLLGQVGSNSLTTGVMSQHGRVLNLNGANGVIFDQTTATAFPGSSGGGVFLKSDGRYVGMVVRGAGEGFNFIVPTRRMQDWAKKNKIEWALDPKVEVPSDEELAKIKVEDSGVTTTSGAADAKPASPHSLQYPFLLIREIKPAEPKAVVPEPKRTLLDSLLSK